MNRELNFFIRQPNSMAEVVPKNRYYKENELIEGYQYIYDNRKGLYELVIPCANCGDPEESHEKSRVSGMRKFCGAKRRYCDLKTRQEILYSLSCKCELFVPTPLIDNMPARQKTIVTIDSKQTTLF